MAEFDPVEILWVLTGHGVRFVVIGGVAARLRGAPLLTQDLDVTPDDDPSNLVALAAALRELEARLRVSDNREGVPFPVEPEMLAAARSWTLSTRAGDLDLILLPAGTRGYADLVRGASPVRVADDPPLSVLVASLADVIRNKEASRAGLSHGTARNPVVGTRIGPRCLSSARPPRRSGCCRADGFRPTQVGSRRSDLR